MNAVSYTNLEVVKELVKIKHQTRTHPIDLKKRREDGHTALSLACLRYIILSQGEQFSDNLKDINAQIFQSLVALNRIQQDEQFKRIYTGLIYTGPIVAEALKVIKTLLKAPGIDIDQPGRGKWSALEMALFAKNEELIYVLRKNGAKDDIEIGQKGFTAKDLDKDKLIEKADSRITKERIKRVGWAGGALVVCALTYYAFIGRKEEKKPPKAKSIKAK